MRGHRVATAACFAGLVLIGCRAEPVQPPPQLHIVRRLLDDGFRTASPPFTRRGYTAIGETRKFAVAASDPLEPNVTCVPAKNSTSLQRPCAVSVPHETSPVPQLIVETPPIQLMRADAKSIPRRLLHPVDAHRIRRFVIRRYESDDAPSARILPYWMAAGLRAWPVLGVGAWDVTSHQLQIPSGAVLTFAVGIEEPAWHVDSAPVQFSIEAHSPEGDVELYRRVLDPSRRPEDRHWFDERVSLAAVGGRTVALHFRVRPLVAGDRRPQLPVWADPTLLAPAAPEVSAPPSIVLVSLDTLRARSMSTYGSARETTPWFSQFAHGATRFTNAYTTFSNTYGAHLSMLTGTYPSRHDVRVVHRLSPAIPTLAERLRDAGYDTAAFTEDAMLSASSGFGRGFATYWENTRIGSGAGDAPGTFAQALAWIARHRDRPFFLFAHTYAVHSPYTPAPPYDSFFANSIPRDESTEDEEGRLAYEQEIRQLNDDVARLVATLDALVPADRFVLVITADHGEEFWEHEGLSHNQLYDEVLHVPLFVRAPGRLPPGRTVEQQVSLVDVTPTLLDFAGVQSKGLDGLSLRGLLEGTTTSLDRETILAESPSNIFTHHAWSFIARRPAAKCFSYELASLDACFDLARDPDERNPLPAETDVALWTAARRHGETVFSSAVEPGAAAPEPVEPERLEKLRALGYVE